MKLAALSTHGNLEYLIISYLKYLNNIITSVTLILQILFYFNTTSIACQLKLRVHLPPNTTYALPSVSACFSLPNLIVGWCLASPVKSAYLNLNASVLASQIIQPLGFTILRRVTHL